MADGLPNQAPRLLLLHEDPAFCHRISHLLRPQFPRLTIDTCTSPQEVHQALFLSRCHAIISSPDKTILAGMSALTSSRRVQPSVPLLMALQRKERDVATNWLDLGVYDFIFDPLDPKVVVQSIHQALVLSKWRTLIKQKEAVLLGLQRSEQHQAKFPRYQAERPSNAITSQHDKLVQLSRQRIGESQDSLRETIRLVETSLKRLRQSCLKNAEGAYRRALQGLMPDSPG